jgi:hypothetical protein
MSAGFARYGRRRASRLRANTPRCVSARRGMRRHQQRPASPTSTASAPAEPAERPAGTRQPHPESSVGEASAVPGAPLPFEPLRAPAPVALVPPFGERPPTAFEPPTDVVAPPLEARPPGAPPPGLTAPPVLTLPARPPAAVPALEPRVIRSTRARSPMDR